MLLLFNSALNTLRFFMIHLAVYSWGAFCDYLFGHLSWRCHCHYSGKQLTWKRWLLRQWFEIYWCIKIPCGFQNFTTKSSRYSIQNGIPYKISSLLKTVTDFKLLTTYELQIHSNSLICLITTEKECSLGHIFSTLPLCAKWWMTGKLHSWHFGSLGIKICF